jgi:hypothetical protein
MELPAFNERVRVALIDAGWTPERSVDTEAIRRAHEARGIKFHDAAESFLRAFGGLVIPDTLGAALVRMDAEHQLSRVTDAQLKDYGTWIGEPLVVIGTAQGGAQLLLLTPRGAVFGAKRDVLVSYGRNLDEVFDRICGERLLRRYDLN